jgi:AcrR family transcriptional regulator
MVDTDRRVRRTRRALHDALLTLMIEKSYDAITVQDIIDRADVGRSTFYSHFTDKRDLLDSGFEDLNQLLAQPPPSAAHHREGILRFSLPLFQHAHTHQRLSRALAARRGASPVQDRFHNVLTSTIRAELDKLVAQHQEALPADDLTVDYIAGALLAVITSWLDTAPHKTPAQVDALFHTLVEPGLRAALQLDRHMSPPHLPTKGHVDMNGSSDPTSRTSRPG